jgi:hypothetical protein
LLVYQRHFSFSFWFIHYYDTQLTQPLLSIPLCFAHVITFLTIRFLQLQYFISNLLHF